MTERQEKDGYTETESTVIFDLLLEHNNEKGFQRLNRKQLIEEAISYVTAGIDTTAYALSVATFYILRTPRVLAKLREELTPISEEGRFEWKNVQALPYIVSAYS